jgi:hypothetical protein
VNGTNSAQLLINALTEKWICPGEMSGGATDRASEGGQLLRGEITDPVGGRNFKQSGLRLDPSNIR